MENFEKIVNPEDERFSKKEGWMIIGGEKFARPDSIGLDQDPETGEVWVGGHFDPKKDGEMGSYLHWGIATDKLFDSLVDAEVITQEDSDKYKSDMGKMEETFHRMNQGK